MTDRNVVLVKSVGRKPTTRQIAKTASTDFDKNSLVEFASGVMNPADDNDTTVLGIILQEIASTDSDYTSATALKDCQILQPGDEVEINWSGTVPTVGTSYGISNAYTVDQTDTTNKVITCTAVTVNNTTTGRMRGVMKTYLGSNNL